MAQAVVSACPAKGEKRRLTSFVPVTARVFLNMLLMARREAVLNRNEHADDLTATMPLQEAKKAPLDYLSEIWRKLILHNLVEYLQNESLRSSGWSSAAAPQHYVPS
jgi:hypothetical protein